MAEASVLSERTSSLLRSEVLQNKWVQAALIAFALFLVYYATGNESSPFNQYVRLADSFMHGRLHVEDPPDYLELARYYDNGEACEGPEPGCKGYVIDPPAPAVLLMPFVAIWGTDLNQVLVSMALGGAAMGLFWVATRQLGWDRRVGAAMTVLLAVGTNFWWAASDGGLWTFAHISAVLFMMGALVEATGQKRPWLVGLLVGAAGLSRLPVFLAFPFFLYLLLKDDARGWREIARDRNVQATVILFGVGLGAMAFADILYNYARFDSVFDKGYDHPQYEDQPWFASGRFDVSYIPRHVEGIFFTGPELNEGTFPYFRPSTFGLALFMTTPAFLYLFNAGVSRLTVVAAWAAALVMIPISAHGTTGWAQFGYRFSMDLFPMLAVLTASGMHHQIGRRKWAVIAVSVFVSLWGPIFLFETRLEDLIGYQWAT